MYTLRDKGQQRWRTNSTIFVSFFMVPKIPGIDAKIVRDDVVIALIDVVQRFPQKM